MRISDWSSDVCSSDLRLYRQLVQHPLFRRAQHIALYLPNDGEIDPRLLLQAAQRRGKATYLPVLNPWPRTRMVFQRIEPGEQLRRNRFGILEPVIRTARQRRVWALDLRSEERRGGKEGVSTCRSRWPPDH